MSLLTNQEYQDALAQWKTSKELEQIGNKKRLEAEEKILKIVGESLGNTGTHHFEGDLKIVTALDQKWNNDWLTNAARQFEDAGRRFPFKIEWKPDNKGISIIKETDSQVYESLIMPALTIKPRKPSFSIKGGE